MLQKDSSKRNSPSVAATVMMEPKLHYFASLFQVSLVLQEVTLRSSFCAQKLEWPFLMLEFVNIEIGDCWKGFKLLQACCGYLRSIRDFFHRQFFSTYQPCFDRQNN
ncbi:unnamed protein product [Lathyrus oleraceus]